MGTGCLGRNRSCVGLWGRAFLQPSCSGGSSASWPQEYYGSGYYQEMDPTLETPQETSSDTTTTNTVASSFMDDEAVSSFRSSAVWRPCAGMQVPPHRQASQRWPRRGPRVFRKGGREGPTASLLWELQRVQPGQTHLEGRAKGRGSPVLMGASSTPQFKRLQGKRNRGREEINFVEIKGDDQLSGAQQWLTKSLTEEQTMKSFSKVRRWGAAVGVLSSAPSTSDTLLRMKAVASDSSLSLSRKRGSSPLDNSGGNTRSHT